MVDKGDESRKAMKCEKDIYFDGNGLINIIYLLLSPNLIPHRCQSLDALYKFLTA